MEKVLSTYNEGYEQDFPVICYDERPCQLIGDVMQPIEMKSGQIEKQDYHYKRNGVCNVLLAIEPLTGNRFVKITERRTKQDYAEFMMELSNRYPTAKKIKLVQDNLNTNNPSSFYEKYPPQQAFDLSEKFEMIYTPKKASWWSLSVSRSVKYG